jgi:peptidoglycan hydrolase CwlO-like protein
VRTLEDVLVSVARVEERIYQISTKQKSIEAQISSIEANVQSLSNKANNRFSERIFWIIVAVLAATIFNEF